MVLAKMPARGLPSAPTTESPVLKFGWLEDDCMGIGVAKQHQDE